MSLIADILTWTQKDLKPWQSDAVRRLFLQGSLSENDLEDLYALLKVEHGIPDPQDRKPNPVAEGDVPDPTAKASPVVLLRMRELKHVNSIAEGQVLDFSPQGLTVIYGPNASGKSGYVRVLKRACRARDQEEVLPNAAFDRDSQGLPEAVFDIVENGVDTSLVWVEGSPAPSPLSAISVFDCRCARAYLDEEQDVAFIPYGLDVVESLAQKVLPDIDDMLDKELASMQVDFSVFDDVLGPTKVGKAISNLPNGGSPEVITALSKVSDTEKARLSELERVLAETDPETKAKSLELAAQRMEELSKRVAKAAKAVNDNMVIGLQKLDQDAEAALKAQEIAATNFRAHEDLLPGTGEQAWRALFDAARNFSTTAAYPTEDFPVTVSGSKCLWCQQSLSDSARARLKRFNAFVTEDITKLAAEKTAEREERDNELSEVSVAVGLDDALAGELAQYNTALLEELRSFEQRLLARLTWLKQAMKTHAWDVPPILEPNPMVRLKQFSSTLSSQAITLRSAADQTKRKVIESERDEISARVRLSKRTKQVLDAITKNALHQRLLQCKEDLKTRPVSDKSKELTRKAVTRALRDALNDELKSLGVSHLKMMLKDRTEAGKTRHKLVLDLPAARNINDILSEGEQRAVAIAAFLGELRLAGHSGGIVFDDPVSSLDHTRRQNVARRLVGEAVTRQVVVFTHDTVFLGELRDAIEKATVPCIIHHLEWENDSPGVVRDGLPWEHKSWRERVDAMEKLQKKLEKSWPKHPGETHRASMRHAYSELRATIERVIQDHVFAGVVRRYRDWVKVDNLGDAVGFNKDEYMVISRLCKTCNDMTEAHDPASAKGGEVRCPADLAKDIAELKKLTDSISARRKAAT